MTASTQPSDGLWKTEDHELHLLVQHYDPDTCLVVVFAASGQLWAFLDSESQDGVAASMDVFGKPYTLHLDPTLPGEADLMLDIPDHSGRFTVSLHYPAVD